jgi:hypothetical protein
MYPEYFMVSDCPTKYLEDVGMTADVSLRPYHAIYAVIMGVGLSIATTRVMEQLDAKKPEAPPLLIVAALIVFVLTAIAFYEGTHEHWRETHTRVAEVSESMTVFDFLSGIGHALFFTGVGYVIALPGRFAWAFVWLLIYDVIASLLLSATYIYFRPLNHERGFLRDSAKRPMKWVMVNVAALVIIFAIGLLATGNLDLRSWLLTMPQTSDGDWSSPGARIYYGFILVSAIRVGIDMWQSHKIRKTSVNQSPH